MATLKSKVQSGFLWMFMGTAGQNLLQLAALLILARLVSPEEFGLVTASMVIIGLIQIFSDMGVGPAIVQFKDIDDASIGTGKTLSALFGLLMGLIVYLIASPYESFIGIVGVKESVQLLAMVLPIAGLTVVSQAILQRNLQFKKLIKFLFLSHVVGQIFVAIPLAYFGYGHKALIYAILAQNIALMLMVNLGQRFVRYQFEGGTARKIMNFGFGQSLGKFANYMAGQIDNLIVGKMLGAGALGYYSRAYQLMVMPANLIGGVIDKVMFPVMASIQEDNERLSGIYLQLNSLLMMVFTPVMVVMFFCSEQIINLALGSQWASAAPVLKVLAAVLFFRVAYKVSDSLSRAKGSVYRRAWRQAIYALMVGLGAYLGHWHGLQGAATGVALAIIGNYFLMLQLSFSLIGFNKIRLVAIFFRNAMVLGTAFVLMWLANIRFFSGFPDWLFVSLNTAGAFLLSILGWYMMRRYYESELALVFQLVRTKKLTMKR